VPAEAAAEPGTDTITDTADGAATSETDDTPAAASEEATPAAAANRSFTTPHPILSDIRVRQALAYCTDRRELIAAVYPFLSVEEQNGLLMDTFLPQGHWAVATEGITTYPFDAEQGIQLLEEAGWMEDEFEDFRFNEDGDPLTLNLLTTDAEFRVTWASVLEQQLLNNCGIQIIRTHAPGSYVFGSRSGLQVRDFELGAFAWVGQADPQGETLYSCDQIPLPENNWEGQNYMGWCNERATEAVIGAVNTLDREERIAQYAIVQQEFSKDMVSLPLFNRLEAVATSPNLLNFRADPTVNSYAANIDEWELEDGGDTVIIGMSQEPTTLFNRTESSMVTNIAASLLKTQSATSYSYDYQPFALTELPTIENGGAVNEPLEVEAGDVVWTTTGQTATLEAGVEVRTADGEAVTYEDGTIEMRQLSVTFEFAEGMTWEDGEPVTSEDMELAHRIECDPDSGAVTYTVCESIAGIEFHNDTSYTITYLPGAQWPEYPVYTISVYANLYTVGAYPAHQELSDGRTLAEVPAAEWPTLPEIAEQPMSYGPYKLVEWQKGQRMVFEANPYYYKGEPPIKTVIVQFFADSNQAVTQLLTGQIDVLGTETLGGGAELERVFDAANEGSIIAYPFSSPTWEHVDMNLYIR
jgi:ABC-type transport system substrate-binding protein